MAKDVVTHDKRELDDAAKAAELIARQKLADEAGANMEAARNGALAKLTELGASEKNAAGARTQAGFLFNAAVRAGIFTEADAETAWNAYVAGHNAATNEVTLDDGTKLIARVDAIEGDAGKDALSRWKNFGRWQVVAQGIGWFDRVSTIRGMIAADSRAGSDYVCLTRACSRLCEAADADAMPDADVAAGKFTVSDETIAEWLTVKAKATTKADFDKKFADAVAALKKLCKEAKAVGLPSVSAELERVHGHYLATKAMTAEERAVADIRGGFADKPAIVKMVTPGLVAA